MTKRNTILYTLLLIAGCIAYTSCSKTEGGRSPCLEPRTYFMKMQSCTSADTGSAGVELQLPAPIVGFIDTTANGTVDSFNYGNAAASKFTLPLSAIADSTRFFIIPDTNNLSDKDTMVFYYQREPVFLSTACGYTMKYVLQSISATRNVIDSARIEISEIANTSDVIHVKVFY